MPWHATSKSTDGGRGWEAVSLSSSRERLREEQAMLHSTGRTSDRGCRRRCELTLATSEVGLERVPLVLGTSKMRATERLCQVTDKHTLPSLMQNPASL